MRRAQLLAINLSVTVEPSWLVYHNDGGKELLKGLNTFNRMRQNKRNESYKTQYLKMSKIQKLSFRLT